MTRKNIDRRSLVQSAGASIVGAATAGIGGGLFGYPASAHAQFRLEVAGVGLTQVPIALPKFKGEDLLAQSGNAIASPAGLVQADLERTGQFRAISGPTDALDEASRIDFVPWRKLGVDAMVVGSINRLADGRLDLRYRLWDVVRGSDMGGQSYTGQVGDVRLMSHRIADAVYQRLTGERGVFSTRIAYVSKNGSRYGLWVADADGENSQSALSSGEPIISPSWSPNGSQLAYVSFESRKPVVYVHDVGSGKRRLLASFRGSNSAPRFSPDGRNVALTLSRDGSSQVFLMDANGGEPRRITQGNSIDTEPVFTPDGQALLFVSDRGGSPQIYRQPLAGGEAQRVSFGGAYSISPAISPDGKTLAHIVRTAGAFKLHLTELATGQTSPVTDTVSDERPSFAPNGKMLLFATKLAGSEALMTTTLDGKARARLAGVRGDIREPDWGPFLR